MRPVPSPILATYRVQLTPDFGFDEAARIVPYLAELGISHMYCSPYLQAAPGSRHGYDVVDPTRVNQQLGGDAGRRRLVETLQAHGMGQVIDVVPNHMAIGDKANSWWWDVLENGPASSYAHYFDVDWNPPEAKLRNRVLMAILGSHYGRAVEAGEIRVVRDGAEFTLAYFEHELPLAPPSLEEILGPAARHCASQELESLAAAFGRLPKATESDEELVHERLRDKEVLKDRLRDLMEADGEVTEAIDGVLGALNADPDTLDALLQRQNYRLAYWRTAVQDLDYRRFFDVDTLVGLRNEDPEVFQASHGLILDWVAAGDVQGLRIDHPDGLRDPEQYLQRLADATGTWIVVEKILEPGERLPETWPVAGTTGYDFLNRLTGLLVDAAAEPAFTEMYARLTGEPGDFEQVVLERKLQVIKEVLAADLTRLTGLLVDICERHRRYRDYTRYELSRALRAVLASFPVYRTYIRQGDPASWQDLRHVVQAVEAARVRRTDLDPELFGFLESLLLLQVPVGESDKPVAPEIEFVMRFQQLSGPVMAKGVEDTAFYNYNRFVALNEVGGDPGKFGLPVDEFHEACRVAQECYPLSMLDTSTHDTKRSEDVRARLALLSEMPGEWAEAVGKWMGHNRVHNLDGLVDRNLEYLLYQVMVGAWPLTKERTVAYIQKASKEAKTQTSWLAPNSQYDQAVVAFVESLFDDPVFQQMLESFVTPLLHAARLNSLSQTLVKLTAPGVPDIYQGTELWDLSLVDPDNRRPVDYDLRNRLLRELDGLKVDEVMARMEEGLPKQFLIRRALRLRKQLPEAFGGESSYEPLEVSGDLRANVVAFTRWGVVATVAPRLVLGARDGWGDTEVAIPAGVWKNVFTGERVQGGGVAVGDLFAQFPVALLRLES